MAESHIGEDEESEVHFEVLTVEEFLSENYALFAVAGILAGISVYLQDFQGSTSQFFVNLGIVSSLLMFVVTAGALVYRLGQQAMLPDEVSLKRLTPYAAMTVALGGLTVSILSITIKFKPQLFLLIDFGVGLLIFMGYLIWFPFHKFRGVPGVSKSTQESIENAPAQANLFVVYLIFIAGSIYGSAISSTLSIGPYEEIARLGIGEFYLVFPGFLLASAVHYLLSFLIKYSRILLDSRPMNR